jgi:hypothetical protein
MNPSNTLYYIQIKTEGTSIWVDMAFTEDKEQPNENYIETLAYCKQYRKEYRIVLRTVIEDVIEHHNIAS